MENKLIKIMTYEVDGYTNKIKEKGLVVINPNYIIDACNWGSRSIDGPHYAVTVGESVYFVLKEDFEIKFMNKVREKISTPCSLVE